MYYLPSLMWGAVTVFFVAILYREVGIMPVFVLAVLAFLGFLIFQAFAYKNRMTSGTDE